MSIIHYHRPGLKCRLLLGESVEWIDNHPRASYIRRCVLSYPFWTRRKDMKRLHAYAVEMGRWTGVPHVLDHVIPLNHPRVCGLTVPENLQVISWQRNLAKGNNWCEDQFEMFEYPPQQLRLDV